MRTQIDLGLALSEDLLFDAKLHHCIERKLEVNNSTDFELELGSVSVRSALDGQFHLEL